MLTNVPPTKSSGFMKTGGVPPPSDLSKQTPSVGGSAPGGDTGIQVHPSILFVIEENDHPSRTDGFFHFTKHGHFTEHRTPGSYLLLSQFWRYRD